MEIICGKNNVDLFQKSTGVGLGNFDGLHVGHMSLINTLIDECKINNLNSIVYTFAKHPENILNKENSTQMLTTLENKKELLKKTSLDYLWFANFNESFSKLRPEDFVENILIGTLKAKLAVVGFNYKFGYKGQGDPYILKEIGSKFNLKVIIIPSIKIDNEIVSSSLIRSSLVNGDIEKASKLLGRNYSIKGNIKEGRRLGSQLGFPTANIYPENNMALPKFGVYITKTLIDNKYYESITNVGRAPTFGQQENISVETHIFNFDKDIYNKEIEVVFLSQIREEKKFNNVENLIEQVNKDREQVKRYFDSKNIMNANK